MFSKCLRYNGTLIDKDIIGFRYHVINTDNESLLHKAYEENLTLQNGTASKIRQLFCKIGFNLVCENQCSLSKKRLIV